MREQPDLAVLALEGLDRRLVVEHRRDDVAVVGARLLAHDDPVAVADRRVDHRVADDLEQEQRALADDLAGEREDVLDDLLGRDRHTGGDPAQHRHVGRLGPLVVDAGDVDVVVLGGPAVARLVARGVGGDDLDGARPVRVAAQVALALERGQLVGHGAGGGEPDRVADLAHARRVPAPVDGVADHLEDLALAVGQRPAVAAVRHLVDVGVPRTCHVDPFGVITAPDAGGSRCSRRSGRLSVLVGRISCMRTAYESRTHISNISSRRVLKESNIRATTRTDVLSNTGSTVALAAGMEDSMSALAWDPADLGYAGCPAPRRPHLVVLPGGGQQVAATGGVRLTRRGRLALARARRRPGRGPRHGRAARRRARPSRRARSPSRRGRPSPRWPPPSCRRLSISEGILAIQLANAMSTAQVSAGQELVIPRG